MDPVELSVVSLEIGREFEHGHARRVLDNNPGLEDQVRRIVTGEVGIARSTRKAREVERLGLTAGSLNVGLKEAFRVAGGWTFEATVRDGVVFDYAHQDSKKEGFDLARYDDQANLARAWSWCFGRRPVVDGAEAWSQFLARRPELKDLAGQIAASGTPGTDLRPTARDSTVFGEIQFGNWGLAYRDMLRLVDADSQIQVDLHVYVTGAEHLNRYLSSGIVTFDSIVSILDQFSRLIRVPVWVLGLEASDL